MDLAQYVNPFIGVDRQGNTLCGPYLPFSMVRLCPDTIRPQKTNGYSSDMPILRFTHTHVSGTGGGSRYGNIGVTPFMGRPRLNVDPFERKDESAEPGYYSVTLLPAGIKAELTVTERCGLHRYTLPGSGPCGLLFDISACIQRDFREAARCIGGFAEWISPTELVGRGDFQRGWGHDFPYSVFFFARLDTVPDRRFVGDESGMRDSTFCFGNQCKAVAAFKSGGTVGLRVGISFVSVANARRHADAATRSFDETRAAARATWNEWLGRVRVEGGDADTRTVFYTFLTRLLCLPTDLGIDDENPLWKSGIRHYWDFYCLWDSVRNANSLLGLMYPQKEAEFLNSLLDVARHVGWLVDAWIAGHSASVQGGSSADVLFCEAKLKGLGGIDYAGALEYMRKNNEVESPDPHLYGRYLRPYLKCGYVPHGVINCVSRHLEYTYQDWCIGRLAQELGQPETAAAYYKSSRQLWALWKDSIRMFAPKTPDGVWVEPFDPYHPTRPDHWNDPYFMEGPSVQWSFHAFQDFAGLVARHGGPAAFVDYVDRFFADGRKCTKETFMHIPYLYVYAGRPDRTAAQVRRILAAEYRNERGGIPDNEDMGCHSAFHMCSAMGIYPIMGQDLYILSTPLFEKIELDLPQSGATLTVTAPGTGPDRPYVRAARLNGKPLDRAWLRHGELLGGGRLEFELAKEPGAWGTREVPPSALGSV